MSLKIAVREKSCEMCQELQAEPNGCREGRSVVETETDALVEDSSRIPERLLLDSKEHVIVLRM